MKAFYSNTVSKFLEEPTDQIIGRLTSHAGASGFAQQLHTQTRSWEIEINILKKAFALLNEENTAILTWGLLLEYPIARREKRIDAVLIANGIIIVIEFKIGSSQYSSSDKEQLLDYCLDLRDFHFESRSKILIPVLLASSGYDVTPDFKISDDYVQQVVYANSANLHLLFKSVNKLDNYPFIDHKLWENSDYLPTPTIIEAATTLYAGKNVKEITNHHAGKVNLTETSNAALTAIKEAQSSNEKIICFITGVPGAGKTLAGLNIAHNESFQSSSGSLATFLSGNGPLIKVLRKALSRDALSRLKKTSDTVKKREAKKIETFIENVHRFIDQYFFDHDKIPNNKVVIFDEAQRAWNAEHSMRKFQRNFSEPEMMLSIMNRHQDWAAIIALVGGGQEINTGEAGLPEWGKIISEKFKNWKIFISPELKVGHHSTGNLTLFKTEPMHLNIVENPRLHLKTSIRSYKADNLSKWVSLVLDGKAGLAREVFQQTLVNYPLVLTRDLTNAKNWLKTHCQGSRRMGIVASSGARRLKPYGLDVKAELEVEQWFLNGREDVRSSYYLETPATEFGIQGLELDWTALCWDADLRWVGNYWDFNSFKGTKWTKVSKLETRQYTLNKYRVLMTRAREGMVIFVPLGDTSDPTRDPSLYNSTFDYLLSCGIPSIDITSPHTPS